MLVNATHALARRGCQSRLLRLSPTTELMSFLPAHRSPCPRDSPEVTRVHDSSPSPTCPPTPDNYSSGFQPLRGVCQKRRRRPLHGLLKAGNDLRAPDGGEPEPAGPGPKGLRRRRCRRPPPGLIGATVLRAIEERRLPRWCVRPAEDVKGWRWGRHSWEKGTGRWRWWCGRRGGCGRGQDGESSIA